MRLNDNRNRLGILIVTISRLGGSFPFPSLSESDSSCSTGAFLAVVSLDLLFDAFGDSFFLRFNSASMEGGNVGESNGSNRKGDLSPLLVEGASDFRAFMGLALSTLLSLGFFFSTFSGASPSRPSKLKRRGDSNGGREDLGESYFAERLLEVPLRLGRTPLIDSPRARPAGEGMRFAPVIDLIGARPFGIEEETWFLTSRCDVRSWLE